MACENGEEPRLMRLAEDLDGRIAKLRASFGDIGDTRLTIMAALALADELSEKKEKLQRLEHELATLHDPSVVAADRAHATEPAVVAALNAAAERIESLTRGLNPTISGSSVG